EPRPRQGVARLRDEGAEDRAALRGAPRKAGEPDRTASRQDVRRPRPLPDARRPPLHDRPREGPRRRARDLGRRGLERERFARTPLESPRWLFSTTTRFPADRATAPSPDPGFPTRRRGAESLPR